MSFQNAQAWVAFSLKDRTLTHTPQRDTPPFLALAPTLACLACVCSHWPVPSGVHGLSAAVLHALGFLLMVVPHCFSPVFIATHQLSLSRVLQLLALLHLFA